MPQFRGFSLVELLVVITIIGILSAIALISYRQIIQQAEDSQRQSDLKTIQSALEQYHGDQHFYPEAGSGECPTTSDEQFRFGCPLKNPPPGNKTYLVKVPKDPQPSPYPQYRYQPLNCSSDKCISYCLYAKVSSSQESKIDQCSDQIDYNLELTRP